MNDNLKKLFSEANLSPELVDSVTAMIEEAIEAKTAEKTALISESVEAEKTKLLEEKMQELATKEAELVAKETALEEKWQSAEKEAIVLEEEVAKIKSEYQTMLESQALEMASDIEKTTQEIREELAQETAQIAEAVSEVTTAIIDALSEKIDQLAEEWIDNNEVALVNESIVHAARNFLKAIDSNAANFAIELNESTRDIRSEYEETVTELVQERNELKRIVDEVKMEKLAEEKSTIITQVVNEMNLSEEQSVKLTKQALKYGVENIDSIMVRGIAKAIFTEEVKPVATIKESVEVVEESATNVEDEVSPVIRAARAKVTLTEKTVARSPITESSSLNDVIAATLIGS